MKLTGKLSVCPPEPMACPEWRAYFDPEGTYGYGKTEDEAIRDLCLEVENWSVDAEDSKRIAAAFNYRTLAA